MYNTTTSTEGLCLIIPTKTKCEKKLNNNKNWWIFKVGKLTQIKWNYRRKSFSNS